MMHDQEDKKEISPKRFKLSVNENEENAETNRKTTRRSTRHSATSSSCKRCTICRQLEDAVLLYNAHPNHSTEELIALTDEKLTFHSENVYERPTYNLTQFNVYCKNGHLCPFESGLIEANVLLYSSGYITQVHDDDSTLSNAVSAHNIGPINQWWIIGFDNGEKEVCAFKTDYADYYLIESAKSYEPFWVTAKEKIVLLKKILEYLLNEEWKNPSYAELLRYVHSLGLYSHPEKYLLQHAQYLCDLINSFDASAPDNSEEKPLIKMSCIKSLMEHAGVVLTNKPKRFNKGGKVKWAFRKATLTPFVENIFIRLSKEVDKGSDTSLNIEEGNAEASGSNSCASKSVVFPARPIHVRNATQFYKEAVVGGVRVEIGNYVMLNSESKIQRDQPKIGRVYSIYIANDKNFCHVQSIIRGNDTILGMTADPRELFVEDRCEDVPLKAILKVIKVEHRRINSNWSLEGGLVPHSPLENNNCSFYITSRYDGKSSRFEEYIQDSVDKTRFNPCDSCRRKMERKKAAAITFENNAISFMNETYRVGSYVYLKPEAYKFEKIRSAFRRKLNFKDSEEFPEYYRKSSDRNLSNTEIPDTFIIAQIEEITANTQIKARIFYRPHNIPSKPDLQYKKDLNYIYWTEIIIVTFFHKVMGKCYVFHSGNIKDIKTWSREGPDRFYYNESYDPTTRSFKKVPCLRKKQGNNEDPEVEKNDIKEDSPPLWPKPLRPLRAMDVFAGCGGLSHGFHQSGLCHTKWAIELDSNAADAFRSNNPDTKVFTNDCNDLLEIVMNNKVKAINMGLPEKGEVEILLGGPPCQGFSGMNRFSNGEYSAFQNSLIGTYLSYCDYYRPKYFVLENVRNFVFFKNRIVLKSTLKCLLAMGYQVAFGILQAGHYGVPQARRRLFIIAAAPGYGLPKFPEPIHVFTKIGSQLSFFVDEKKFQNGQQWVKSAPLRSITVRDAISDLPVIKNGFNRQKIDYDSNPQTQYQREMRANVSDNILCDHICKEMSPLVMARIELIPTEKGADWRDLPNIEVKLNDGTCTNKLKYIYETKEENENNPPRRVRPDRQGNTLIPWCLPNTADKNNNWKGLYGRLDWNQRFQTTVTNPEPMGKQGKVLHPEQNRVVSVKECARSQGFPDNFKFRGKILNKYSQIGNAVPPPLGTAIGREICKAFNSSQPMVVSNYE